MKIDID